MNEDDSVILTLTTLPDEESATAIAEALVAENLAACVTRISGAVSIYQWKGDTCRESEVLLLIKSPQARIDRLERRLAELHPYETPEILHLPTTAGHQGYLDWVLDQCKGTSTSSQQ